MNKEKDQLKQPDAVKKPSRNEPQEKAEEFGGPKGPEPTRYGDWEQKGRVSDF